MNHMHTLPGSFDVHSNKRNSGHLKVDQQGGPAGKSTCPTSQPNGRGKVEQENQLLKVVLWPSYMHCSMCVHVIIHQTHRSECHACALIYMYKHTL